MLSKELLHRRYILLTMLILAVCGCFVMVSADAQEISSHNIAWVYLFTFAFLFPGIFMYMQLRTQQDVIRPLKWFGVLLVWMTIISLIFAPNLRTAIFQCLNALIPLAAMICMYAYASRYSLSKSIYWMAFVMLLIFTFQYARIFSLIDILDTSRFITSYFPLFVLPLVLFHPSKIIRYLSIVIITLVIFSSLKRGGLVALAIGLVGYAVTAMLTNTKGSKSLWGMLIALAVLIGLFYYIAASAYGGVIGRIMSIEDDGGSGRTAVWATTWQMIAQSDVIAQLIGHGFNGVVIHSPMELSAHNDFLEAWYDYGFTGVVLYIGALISLTKFTLGLIKKKSPMAASMAMLLILMWILSMISHVLIFYFMTLCCMTIGLIAGQSYYNEHHE